MEKFSKSCTDPLKADNLKKTDLILCSISTKFLALIGTGQKLFVRAQPHTFETLFPAGSASETSQPVGKHYCHTLISNYNKP